MRRSATHRVIIRKEGVSKSKNILPSIKSPDLLVSGDSRAKELWERCKEFRSRGDYKSALNASEELRSYLSSLNNMIDVEKTYQFDAELFFDMKDFKNALIAYKNLKSIADANQNINSKMVAYRQLGECYKHLRLYKPSLICFKKILQLAWFYKKLSWELLSYDYIGIIYYYLGDFDRARYYIERMWKGDAEREDSDIRMVSNNALKNKMARKKNSNKQGRNSVKKNPNDSSDDETQLPSPKSGAGSSDYMGYSYSQRGKSNNMPRQVKPFILLSHLSPVDAIATYMSRETRSNLK